MYINLLPDSAQAVIGQVHQNTMPARKLLEDEGFRHQGYVDIFDAGPTLEADLHDIRAVRESRYFKSRIQDRDANRRTTHCLLSNTHCEGFRCVLADLDLSHPSQVDISAELAEALQINQGDAVRVVSLFSTNR